MPQPPSEHDRLDPASIQEQLNRVCQSPLFVHSRRYPTFLEYVVRRTLEGDPAELKERTIGIEAFGRASDYDLNADPIVRVTAAEVRKRLAQYYYAPEHQQELRIELRPGSYVPEFCFQSTREAENAVDPEPVEEALLAPSKRWHLPALSRKRMQILSLAAASTLLVAVLGYFLWQQYRNSAMDEFWSPVASASAPVVISVGSVVVLNPPVYALGPATDSVGLHPLFADPVAMADTIAISNLQRALFRFRLSSTIQSSTSTSYADLQHGPVILVSAFNNPWTMRLTAPLRYHFVQKSVEVYGIEDRNDPQHQSWSINTRDRFTQIGHDYALVARLHDPTTDQIVFVAAGIGENGTIAASEFISSPHLLDTLRQNHQLPRKEQNWEAVLETKTIDGKPGPPHAVASYSW